MKYLKLLLILFLFLFIKCKDSDNPVNPVDNNGSKITTSEEVSLTSETIGTGGGSIVINKPGDALNGLEIFVPPNSFKAPQTFNVSYLPIIKHDLGEVFNPVSPLIKIINSDLYSAFPIKVKIPIQIPAGFFAMGFFYNSTSGELEGIPLEELTDKYVIISTKHFTVDGKISKGGNYLDEVTYASVVVSMIGENKLKDQGIISTNFKPSVNDWEFINYGSYISTGGHCAGQSISALWYYLERTVKQGATPLFHLADKYNDPIKPQVLWQDNPRGYRFASTVQEDIRWNDQWIEELNMQFNKPDITFKAFALSILVTKGPQLVLIRKNSPPNEAHAMLVYKVDYPGNKLYIADPNYPGNRDQNGNFSERVIEYKTGQLGPYISGLKASSPGIIFDQIGYFGQKAFLQWEQLANRWADFENGIIGNDRFPSYKLYIGNTSGVELTDGITVSDQTLKIVCKSGACENCIQGSDKLQSIEVYDESGSSLGSGNSYNGGTAFVNLKNGANKIGIYITGLRSAGNQEYVDFKWLTVNYNQPVKLTISPNPLTGQVNKDYTLTAIVEGPVPNDLKYVWNIQSDGYPEEIVKYNDNSIIYKFTKTGNYGILLSLYDITSDYPIATAYANAIISGAEIFMTRKINITLNANFTFNNPLRQSGNIQFSISGDHPNSLIWSENEFSIDYNYEVDLGYDTAYYDGMLTGRISEDGDSLLNLLVIQTRRLQSLINEGVLTTQEITCENLSFKDEGWGYFSGAVFGSSIDSKVTHLVWSGKIKNDNTGLYETYALEKTAYDQFSVLRVEFWK